MALGIGLALSAIGTGLSIYGQMQQTTALRKGEEANKQQLWLDTLRRNREAVRTGIQKSAQAEFNANAQGAQGGSGLLGGQAQIYGEVNRTMLANNQNADLGYTKFAANEDYYNASTWTGFGQGLQGFGNMFMGNAGAINRVTGNAFA